VTRIAPRDGLTLHPSDNREELARAAHALELAAEGRHAVIVSSGDPGVFAMASALFEALEAAPQHLDLPIAILPGITACWRRRRRGLRWGTISARSTCRTI
jgi:precorrin-3B C17-methyltransferase